MVEKINGSSGSEDLKSHCAAKGVHGEPKAENAPKGKHEKMMGPHSPNPNEQKSRSDVRRFSLGK